MVMALGILQPMLSGIPKHPPFSSLGSLGLLDLQKAGNNRMAQ